MTDDELKQNLNTKLRRFAETKHPADYPSEAEQAEIPKVAQRKAVDPIRKRLGI